MTRIAALRWAPVGPPGALRPVSARAGWNSKDTPPANYILVIIRVTGVASASDRRHGTDETSANRVSEGKVRYPARARRTGLRPPRTGPFAPRRNATALGPSPAVVLCYGCSVGVSGAALCQPGDSRRHGLGERRIHLSLGQAIPSLGGSRSFTPCHHRGWPALVDHAAMQLLLPQVDAAVAICGRLPRRSRVTGGRLGWLPERSASGPRG
jgi:hypothetical protein